MGIVSKVGTAALKAGAVAALSANNKKTEQKSNTQNRDAKIDKNIFLPQDGRIPHPDTIARQKGYENYKELEEYKKKNPELYNAMGGVKYGPIEGSALEERVFEISSLQSKAKEKIIDRISNNADDFENAIQIFDSNKWQNTEDAQKYNNIINRYVDDWIALENMGYFNHISKSDREYVTSSLKGLKNVANNKKDLFSKYRNENEYNKNMWSNKYGAMTWEELDDTEQKIKDALLNKNETDKDYSLQEYMYVKSLRNNFDNAESYDRYIEIVNMPFDELTREFLDTRRVLKKYNDIQDSRNATYLDIYNENYQVLHDAGYITKEEKMAKIKDDSDGYLKQLKDMETNLAIDAKYGGIDALKSRYALLEELYFRGYSNKKTADMILNAINDEQYLNFVEKGKLKFDRNEYMTDTEYDVACYYVAKQGEENEYLDKIEDELQRREMKEKQQDFASFADKMPILSSIVSVPMNLVAAGEQLLDMGKYMVTGDVDYNYHALGASTIRGTVANNINDPFGSFIYNTTMSTADSFAAMGLSKLVTGTNDFGSVILGLSAAGDATNNAISRGMSDGYAFANGIAAGVFETLFEKWSIGKFSEGLDNLTRIDVNNLSKFFGKNIFNNALEENITEVANITYDSFVNGKYSQYETSIKNYMISGLSETSAKRKVALELADRVAQASVSGALMSFGFTSAGVTKKSVLNTINKSIDAAINRLQQDINSPQSSNKKIEVTPYITEQDGIRTISADKNFDENAFIDGLWDGAENTAKSSVEKSQPESVENYNENGIIKETRILTLDDLTKDVLKTKPLNSRIPSDWIKEGGSIEIDKYGNWIYTDKFGIRVKYINGYPDYRSAGAVFQTVNIGRFTNRNKDKRLANKLAPNGPRRKDNVWHHSQDGYTMEEVDGEIHRRFTHKGGYSLWKRKEQ